MKENIEAIRRYYDVDPQREWDRLGDRHPFEFILTAWMMDKYIRPGDTILDIGGGPGRYSIHYAQKGCEGGFTHSYMWHPRNILPFMETFGLRKLHLFGQEGITSPNEPQLLERGEEEFERWVELAKKYLEVPELLAFSEHAMYIGEKP